MVNVQPASAGTIPPVRNFYPTPTMGIGHNYPLVDFAFAYFGPVDDVHKVVWIKHPEGVEPRAYFKNELQEPLKVNPWRYEPFFRDNIARWVELLPRPSVTQPGLVAYYQSPEKRLRDIQTPIKAGRFLQKYFGDLLDQTEIQRLALEWETEFKVPEVKITQDPDEIEEVYEHGPDSCMGHHAGYFNSSVHPCRIYAGPDLGLAYLGPSDDATARCIVWPEKKIYCDTQYGDEPRIRTALEAIGYRKGRDSEFTGARLRRVMDRWDSRYVVPYSDTHDTAWDDGKYLILGGGGINLRGTGGLSEPQYTCDDCGDDMDDDDRTYIEFSDRDVCSSCYSQNYFYCEETDTDYPDDQRADTPPEYRVSKRHVESSDEWFYCEITEMYYPNNHYEAVELFEGETCEETHAANNGFWCHKSKSWSLDHSEKVTLPNGLVVHRDAFDSEDEMHEWAAANDPNQLKLPIQEAA